jgi:hypothetical protein
VRDLFYTYGPPELCVWKVASGTFWLQTTEPQYSRKLDKRQDTSRVGITGVNHYRRTYTMPGNWRKLRRLVTRYLPSAGDHISGAISRQDASQVSEIIRTAGVQHGALKTRRR